MVKYIYHLLYCSLQIDVCSANKQIFFLSGNLEWVRYVGLIIAIVVGVTVMAIKFHYLKKKRKQGKFDFSL